MPSFLTFHASDFPQQEVAGILRDYVALDRARLWRRLLVVRCGVLALTAFIVARLILGLSGYPDWIPVLVCLTPPLWAWMAELRLSLRLSNRLRNGDRPATYTGSDGIRGHGQQLLRKS